MQLMFTVLASPTAGEQHQTFVFELAEATSMVIGRAADVLLRLQGGGYISRYQVAVGFQGGQCVLRDLGSRNKTFIRRQGQPNLPSSWQLLEPEQALPVFDGDYIRLGQTAEKSTVLAIKVNGLRSPKTGAGSLPDYQLLEALGEGGAGIVYRARRVTPGHPAAPPGTVVALKVILPEKMGSKKDELRFKREIRLGSLLRHPHIIPILDAYRQPEGHPWLAMEYIPGGDASQLAPFSLDEALQIADQILSALAYAHRVEVPEIIGGKKVIQQGVVHRDLKPSNILVSRGPAGLQAKLTDFGLAKAFQLAGLSNFTESGEISGTFAYMSPDQLLNYRAAGPVADIYSFGATLYTLLTGQTPYPSGGLDIFEIFEAAIVPLEKWRPFSEQDQPERWAAVGAVIEKAMAKDPQQRYRSAGAMRADLAEIGR
jgi:eukaryotic-like serine/threonine-protein kinase